MSHVRAPSNVALLEVELLSCIRHTNPELITYSDLVVVGVNV